MRFLGWFFCFLTKIKIQKIKNREKERKKRGKEQVPFLEWAQKQLFQFLDNPTFHFYPNSLFDFEFDWVSMIPLCWSIKELEKLMDTWETCSYSFWLWRNSVSISASFFEFFLSSWFVDSIFWSISVFFSVAWCWKV